MNKTFAEPLLLKRGQRLKNRLVMAPMGTQQSFFNDVVSPADLAYYRNRGGDLAAIITGAAQVQINGRTMPGMFGVYSDAFLPGLTRLASAIRRNGAKAILQIFHAGRMTASLDIFGLRTVSASAVAAERPCAELPYALSDEEVLGVIADFRQATLRAIEAGFDGIELHGANTYLIQQFYSPHSNRRADRWGGAVNSERFRFIDALLDAVIEAAEEAGRPDFIIGYRFSPEEFETPGITFDDTLYLIDRIAGKNIDYLHVSLNDYRRRSTHPNHRDSPILDICHDTIAGRLAFIGVGGIRTPQDAAAVLRHADLAAVGTALLLDPDWAGKVLSGNAAAIRTLTDIPEDRRPVRGDSLWEDVQKLRADSVYDLV